MKKVRVIDTQNWKIEEQKESNKHSTLICYRKYLDEALIVADEGKNSIKLYYDVFKHFKTVVEPQIDTTSTKEYVLKYDNSNIWYHRDKNRLILNLYEFLLKRVCLSDEVNFTESLKRVHAMSKEDIFKKGKNEL